MNLGDILTYIATKASQTLSQDIGNGKTVRDIVLTAFNLRQKDFSSRHEWPWREKTDVFQTIQNYTSGTVSVTNNSKTVTGVNTVWTSAMEGRYIKLDRDQELYEIATINSATSLTLRQNYIEGTGSSLGYLIWNRYYSLPPDVPQNNQLILWRYPYKSKSVARNELHPSFLQPYQQGFPAAWTFGKVNRVNSRYNTGTVTVSNNSRTLTGTGTSWLDNVQSGGEITIDSDVYNVESVDSDTQITMVQNSINAITDSTYRIDSKNRQTIMLSSTPDPIVNFNLTYYKKPYNLVNDNDVLDVWEGFEHIPIIAAYSEILDKLTSERTFVWLSIYEKMVKEAWTIISDTDTPEEATRYINRSLSNYRAGLYS